VNSSNIEKFQFQPSAVDGLILLPFIKGQSKAGFDVTSLDNDILDGDKTLSFTILSISPGYDIGVSNTLSTMWVDDETPAQVNFVNNESQTLEDINDKFPIKISLSHAAKADGFIKLSIESVDAIYGTHFTTEPALSHGIINLPIAVGNSHAEFWVFPVNDELFNEQRSISYTIVEATGGLEKGVVLQHELRISDDELRGRGKGYEIFAGSWRYKKRYEYNEVGQVSKVYWDQNTPGHSGGVHTYVYNAAQELEKIIESRVREEIFTREGNRIVKSEEYTNGLLTKYTLYGYDAAGNIGEAAVHYRQPDGSIKLSLIFVYLYHTDHNVYKVLSYNASGGADNPVLIGTKTFENYLDVENPFPMVDILPGYKSQPKLPSSYRIEENGHDITYQFNYHFSNEGRPLSRTATSPSGSETAHYEYY
jgi:hypothetical protein